MAKSNVRQKWLHTYYLRYTHTDNDTDDDDDDDDDTLIFYSIEADLQFGVSKMLVESRELEHFDGVVTGILF